MCGHLLHLLLAVLQVCSATEYYVRPTEPADTTCPGQKTCLTLNEYTNNTDHYIKSNTVFIFLSGKHHMDRPLEVIDMQNVTLKLNDTENVQPSLVPQFPCEMHGQCLEIEPPDVAYAKRDHHMIFARSKVSVCCSAIRLINVTLAHIDGIQITANLPYNVSGLIIEQSTDIYIDNMALTFSSSKMNTSEFGLLVYNSSRIVVDSLQANNFSSGISACKSNSINISNTQIQNCNGSGVLIFESNSVSVENVMSKNNRHGILLALTNYIIITNGTLLNNSLNGLTLMKAKNGDIRHSLSHSNGIHGLFLANCTYTFVNGIHASHNAITGLTIYSCIDLSMTNILAKYSRYYGMNIHSIVGIMRSVYASNNNNDGIFIFDSEMVMENVSAEYNQFDGIDLNFCDTLMSLSSSNHNGNSGIVIAVSGRTVIINSTSNGNNGSGISLENAHNTSIILLSLKYNGNRGLIDVHSENTTLTDSNFIHNVGGDISLIQCTNFSIMRTVASIIVHMSKDIYFAETLFSGLSSSCTICSSADPTSQPAIVELYNSSVAVYNCSFTQNTISAIKAIGSEVTFSGEMTFSHNRALTGTALIFARSSTLILTENCKVSFIENSASSIGGVIYINTEESYMSSMTLNDLKDHNRVGSLTTSRTECFIHVQGSRFDTRLVFINNTAGKGGDVLYGGLVALGWDGDWNCLLSFKNISDMSQQNGLSTITSNPSRVCFCKGAEPDCLTVADPKTHHIYPGQTITIPAVVVGQDFGTVTGSVYAKFINTSFNVEMEHGQNVANINQSQCSSIEYTIFSQNEVFETIMVLAADNIDVSYTLDRDDNQELVNSWTILNEEPNYNILASNILRKFLVADFWHRFPASFTEAYYESLMSPSNRTIDNFYKFIYYSDNPSNDSKFVFPKEIYGYPIYINISFLLCPPGFSLTSEKPFKCDCNHQLQHLPTVKCHIQHQTISRSGLVWVGSDGNETVITSQQCPLDYCKQEDINVTLNNSDSQCNYNHSGTLCGGCQAGLSLVLGSNRCQHCSNTHIGLLIPFAISGIVLVFFIKVTDLTLSQGTLNCFIFYANVIKANEHLLFPEKQTPLTVFISWLNLDLGIETCLYNGLSAYVKVWLQFVFPLYIWSIAGLIIVLSRYSDRVAKVMGNNSVPVLATLFLLSYAKLLRTNILALSFSILTTTDSSKAVWSTDGNMDYFGPKHALLLITAVAVLLIFWLPYTLVLFSGQWLYRCKSHFVTRMLIKIKPFLDAHYGPMKSNHRYWYGALLLLRVTILLLSVLIPANHTNIVVFCITVCSFLLTYFTLIVYQSLVIAMFAAILYANLGILTASHLFTALDGYNVFLPSNLLVGLAFAQFIGLVLFKFAIAFNFPKKIRQLIHNQSPTENNDDENWEPYEEAALLREREALIKKEADVGGITIRQRDTVCAHSIASLPTYGAL